MALSSVERIRLKIADRPKIRRSQVTADGLSEHFKLEAEPIQTNPAPQVWVNDVLQVETTDYAVDYTNGIVVFVTAPIANAKIVFQYYSVIYTDAEIQDFLDQSGANLNIAAAHILYAWAADAARLAKRETKSGGGALGAITQDTSVAARELRATAKSFMDWEIEYGTDLGSQVPADGLTEIPWTEAAHHDIEDQVFIREN
ncbi:MAG TPA: hypothetical protein VFK94_01605 [Patescibacteria group bacterium]|nr:hypothetical protein [Patescibacteria group bacterium]